MTTRLRAAGVEAPKRSAISLSVFVRHRFLLVPAGVLLAAFFVEGSIRLQRASSSASATGER